MSKIALSLADTLRSAGLLPFADISAISHENMTVEPFTGPVTSPDVVIAVYENEIKRPLRSVPYGSALGEYLLPQLDRARYSNDDGSEIIR
jgi:hypothetical protein